MWFNLQLPNIIHLEYLKKGEYNFIAVNWSLLAAGEFLIVEKDGVPVAGATLAAFIEFLIQNTATPLQDFHLIGYSSGVILFGIYFY